MTLEPGDDAVLVGDGSKRWRFRGHAVQDVVDPEGNQYQLRESDA